MIYIACLYSTYVQSLLPWNKQIRCLPPSQDKNRDKLSGLPYNGHVITMNLKSDCRWDVSSFQSKITFFFRTYIFPLFANCPSTCYTDHSPAAIIYLFISFLRTFLIYSPPNWVVQFLFCDIGLQYILPHLILIPSLSSLFCKPSTKSVNSPHLPISLQFVQIFPHFCMDLHFYIFKYNPYMQTSF